MTIAQPLERLFRPSSAAIIGASNYTQKGGGFLLKGLIKNKFKGKLYPVHPRESEILGLPSYPTVNDIRGEVDLAVIAVSASLVPQVMTECARKGVKFAVIHSVGFAELGRDGETLQNVPITKSTGELFELEDQMIILVAAIREGRELSCSGEGGKWSVAMCLAAQQSVSTGQPVPIRQGFP